jgi:hypothetical protein
MAAIRRGLDGKVLRTDSGITRGEDCCCACDCEAHGPIADFTSEAPTDACFFEFTSTSTEGMNCGPIVSWEWSNTTGWTDSGETVNHTLDDNCGHTEEEITLKVTDSSGCQDSVTKTVSCCRCDGQLENEEFCAITLGFEASTAECEMRGDHQWCCRTFTPFLVSAFDCNGPGTFTYQILSGDWELCDGSPAPTSGSADGGICLCADVSGDPLATIPCMRFLWQDNLPTGCNAFIEFGFGGGTC